MTETKIKSKAEQILRKYFDGEYPEDVRQYVQGWIASKDSEVDKDAALRRIFDTMVNYRAVPGDKAFSMLEEWHRRLGVSRDINVLRRTLTPRPVPLYRTWPFRAAALAPVLLAAGWLALHRLDVPSLPEIAMERMDVSDTPGAQSRTVFTDGSVAFVKPGSSICYAKDFGAGRKVAIRHGEVYFDVAKDSARVFDVEVLNENNPLLTVRVLGTKFDVNANPGEPYTTVTLYEGRIAVHGLKKEGGAAVGMQPGRRMVVDNATGGYRIENVRGLLPDWIAGKLKFVDSPGQRVFGALEWYYGVRITTEGKPDDIKYSFHMRGDESLDTILSLMQSMADKFNYDISGREVTVRMKN